MKHGARRCNLCEPGELCGYCRCDVENLKRSEQLAASYLLPTASHLLQATCNSQQATHTSCWHKMNYQEKVILEVALERYIKDKRSRKLFIEECKQDADIAERLLSKFKEGLI